MENWPRGVGPENKLKGTPEGLQDRRGLRVAPRNRASWTTPRASWTTPRWGYPLGVAAWVLLPSNYQLPHPDFSLFMVTAPWPHGGTAREGRVYEVTSRYALRVIPTHSKSMVLAEYESECRNFFNSAFVTRGPENPKGFKSVERPWLDTRFFNSGPKGPLNDFGRIDPAK